MSRELLAQGQERFSIYCAVCHGEDGYGTGIVVRRGFPAPPSYHDERLRQAKKFVDKWLSGLEVLFGLNRGKQEQLEQSALKFLGYLIAASAASFNTAGVFAGLIMLAVVASLFSLAMRKLEARLLRWKPSLTSA